jgi:hypothetical protein
MTPHLRKIDALSAEEAAGKLPRVSVVTPGFAGDARTDDHPHGDPRAAQKFARDAFAAFANSPQWQRGLFVLTYDEWGGFFDHVAPPILPDARASANDADNFGQAGFRVPTVLASPRGSPDSSITPSTTTPLSCASSSGGSSARRRGRGCRRQVVSHRTRSQREQPRRDLAVRTGKPDVGFDLAVKIAHPNPDVGPTRRPPPIASSNRRRSKSLQSGY